MAVKTNYEKNGNQYYRVTATVGKDAEGRAIRKEFYGKSKKEAEGKRDEYLKGLNSGFTIDYDKVKLGELMHQWLFEVLHISNSIKPSTFDRYEGLFRNYIKISELNNLVVSDIKSIQIQRYYNRLYEQNSTPATIKNVNKLLRYFFNYAIKEDFLIKNPCYKIVIPGDASEKMQKEINPFTDDEVEKIKIEINDNIEMMFLLDLGTGLRAGELLALSLRDIDCERGVVTVNKNIKTVKDIKKDGTHTYKTIVQIPKTRNSTREVPIPSKLIPLLKKYIISQKEKYLSNGLVFTDDSLLFTTESCNFIFETNLLKSFKRSLKRADVAYRNFHNIRHTYATRLFEMGVPLKTVSTLLGHSNINITANTYTHVMPKQKEIAAEKLNYIFN